MWVFGYLRASTNEQDASRAKNELEEFAARNNLTVAYWFIENESGASLKRPENKVLQSKIASLLSDGKSYNYIESMLGCSRHTISKVKKSLTC
ncbi:recombinase family protein [Zooshikella sp. RANM57]|uniref:recombinase family protein n=1 Tax=Zooshikella sp. RANM57 TaxID=3425863 RepID=UPI003D6EF720